MALNFPSSPNVNDTYTFSDKTWTYNGNAWALSYGTLNTGLVPEGSNLYFSNARVLANVTQLGYITSSSLSGYASNAQLTSFASTANTLAQFGATTSAQLLGVISDETGSGSLVFATTPTLVTPVLGLATGTSVMLSANIGAAAGNISGNFTASNFQTTGNVNSASGLVTGSLTAGTLQTSGNVNTGNLRVTTNSTLGTVVSGTWNGSSISTTYTDAKVTSVNGQTGAATGFATTANTLAQFGATTSAQLLGVISDETGSGALVFATSPTLVTPALGTPSSGTVTNLTGTASININGTVGATTASTGAFTTVTATGSIQGQASNAFKMNSNSGQYYHFDNASGNSFMGLSAANVVDLYAGGALSATFRATGLAVTGTLSATGITTLSAATTPLLLSGAGSSSTTLASNYAIRINAGVTAANYGGIFFDGSTSYDSFFGRVPTALSGINDGIGYVTYSGGAPTLRMLFSSTGLAVTGTLSATGTLSGGTSGTGYSFSGSAPATSLTLDSSGNLGIGTSSPAVKLQVVGTSGSASVRLGTAAGSNEYQSITYGGAAGGSEYGWQVGRSSNTSGLGGDGAFYFYDIFANATRMSINSAGNLGLGVTPSAWVSSYRAFSLGYSSNGMFSGADTQLGLTQNAYLDSGVSWRYTTSNPASQYIQVNSAHQWFTAPSGTAGNAITFTQAMTLDASGRLSLGTTTASLGFSSISLVGGPTGANTGIQLTYNSSTYGGGAITTVNAAGGGLSFYTFTGNVGSESFTERARIDSSGNVGIGTTSPLTRLDVVSSDDNVFQTIRSTSSGATNVALRIHDGTTGTGSNGIYLGRTASINYLWTYENEPWVFGANNGERMRLDSSGNLGIGTSSPTYTLDVVGTIAATQNSAGLAGNFQNTDTTNGYGVSIAAGGTSATRYSLVARNPGGTQDWFKVSSETGQVGNSIFAPGAPGSPVVATISTTGLAVTGAMSATGDITTSYSDARLKNISGKIENALDKVLKLTGVYYKNNDLAKSFGYASNEPQVGVLAGEVEAVLPEVVKAAPFDIDQDGNSKTRENYKTVQYERLVPLLIEAIKEQQAVVAQLQARIDAAGL